MKRILSFYFSVVVLVFLFSTAVSAQGTAFSYQGSLNTSGTPASGNHDFEFAMFNGGDVQIGSTLTRLNVPVSNGVFAVQLDFGNQFQGADRFLEIRVRPAGGGSFTTLTPRQLLTSAPHAIRSLDSAQLGGVPAIQYVVSGASSINAATQFNIGGNRVLSVPGNGNTFLGINSGNSNTGLFNSFFGNAAGASNTDGQSNSFFGIRAGEDNTTGSFNSFFGSGAGSNNTTGRQNSFFGDGAGTSNTTASDNSFFGSGAGLLNTSGTRNAFFGQGTGAQSTTGSENAFFGHQAGGFNGPGASSNSFFGANAGLFNAGSRNAFFGQRSGQDNTTGSDNSFFGNLAGENNTTGSRNAFFGNLGGGGNTTGLANSFFGSEAGLSNTTASNNAFFGTSAGRLNTTASDNTFVGAFSGELNTTGSLNSFFGKESGRANTIGGSNAFFGSSSGASNTTGFGNSFFGSNAGAANSAASDNSFFGRSAGASTTTGASNAFFGANAGLQSTVGQSNSFFGINAGFDNTTGTNNSFFGARSGDNTTVGTLNSAFGADAGDGNVTGNSNSYFGANSDSGNGLANATALGFRAFVTQNNSLILGSINGVNGATANTNVGIGNTAPINRLTIGQPETPLPNGSIGVFNGGGTFVTVRDTVDDIEGFVGADSNGVLFGSLTDSIVRIRTGNINRLTFDAGGTATFSGIVNLNSFTVANQLDTGGATAVCRNASNRLSTCSSSLRYKENVTTFRSGLNLINCLRPVSFNWREGGMLDLGLVAEEVAKIEPLLTTTNDKGEVEGVKYDRVGVVLINAIKEQQAEIAAQAEVIKRQQQTIDALVKLVCATGAAADICREKK